MAKTNMLKTTAVSVQDEHRGKLYLRQLAFRVLLHAEIRQLRLDQLAHETLLGGVRYLGLAAVQGG